MSRHVHSLTGLEDRLARYRAEIDASPELIGSPLLDLADRLLGRRLPAGLAWRLAKRWEGGDYRSRTLRRILLRQGVVAGAYSYGGLLQPGSAQGLLRIGRYASIAWNVRWGINHPLDTLSLSPIFYLPQFGVAESGADPAATLDIGHDAWIAEYVVITSKCQRIGIGAVVGAGSVVTQNIPDFAIAVGAPARIIRYRFDPDMQEALRRSQWWRLSPAQLRPYRDMLSRPLTEPAGRAALAEIEAIAQACPPAMPQV